MSKFNASGATTARSGGPVVTVASPTTPLVQTFEGAPAYARDKRGELFMLGVANMVSEQTFYESADDRDQRYRDLIAEVAVNDPEWISGFLPWLRRGANLRSASLVGALEAARAMLAAGLPGSRAIVSSVLQRADEPGEALAYWMGRYGRAIPKPVKRGIADAAQRLYREYQLLKYDTASRGVRFGDVLELCHVVPVTPQQGHLFRYAIDRRHGRDGDVGQLPMVQAQLELRGRATLDPHLLADPAVLKAAGMTWEDALSLAGQRVHPRALWEALIPSMGIFAQLRNLRNFDQHRISDSVAGQVVDRLTDPDQVRRSGILPLQWYAAYLAVPSLRWGHALDQALGHSLALVRDLGLRGRSLVLIDTSASMTNVGYSARGTMRPVDTAAVFGVSLASALGADLHGFANGTFRHYLRPGASVIEEVKRFSARVGEVGHGTLIGESIRKTFQAGRHDRVFVLSDEQSADRYDIALPATVPLYGFNLSGHQVAMGAWGTRNRIQLGGLTDATFKLIPLIEAGRQAAWPWMMEPARAV